MRRILRLAEALLLLLALLLPVMLVVGAAEGTLARVSPLFWVLLLLPLLALPLLWRRREPEESEQGLVAAAREVERRPGVARELGAPELALAVAPVMDVRRAYVEGGVPVAEGVLKEAAAGAFERLQQLLAPRQATPLLEAAGEGEVRVLGLPEGVDAELRRRSSAGVNLALFLATILTTVWAGAQHRGVDLLEQPAAFVQGLPYAAALLAILGIHELGHYVVARRYGVEVTLPYFIPVPMGLGTLGAFIQIKSLIRSRRAVFDIGIAGPLSGLVIALPALYVGLEEAGAATGLAGTHGVSSGSSILLALIYQLAHGGDLGTASVRLSPVGFAGWIGLIVTALNLVPVGQLDGGHLAYALFGRRRSRLLGIGVILLMAGLGLTVWPGLLIWTVLIALIAGFSHAPALDDVTPPGPTRFLLGALALVLLVLIVVPVPGGTRGLMLDCPYM